MFRRRQPGKRNVPKQSNELNLVVIFPSPLQNELTSLFTLRKESGLFLHQPQTFTFRATISFVAGK